jgi:hypothetical protein
MLFSKPAKRLVWVSSLILLVFFGCLLKLVVRFHVPSVRKGLFGFQTSIRSLLLGAIVCLGRLRLQSLNFKSQRLRLLSKPARF